MFSPATVLHLPQPANESLEHRSALASSYDGVPTEFGLAPVEIATMIGAESLLRGLQKNNIARRKKGDPRRALVTRISAAHVLSAGLMTTDVGGRYPKQRGAYVFKDGDGENKPDNTPLSASMLGHNTLQVADLVASSNPDQVAHIAGYRKQQTKASALEALVKGTSTADLGTGESQNDGLLAAGLRRKKGLARIRGVNTRRDKRDRRNARGTDQAGAYDNIFEGGV